MKLKTLLVSVLVLAALSVAAYIARRPTPPPSADARINQPLVERAAIEKAAKLKLSDTGKSVELVRQTDGTWRVASYFDLPADFGKLSGFVGSLTEAKIQRLVTSSAERIGRLEFKDTKVELLDASDKTVFTVTLGKNAEVGGGRYVRFGDESKAYLANLTAWLDVEAKNWANSELINVKADDIARVEIPFAEGGPVTLTRAKKEDPWTSEQTPAGQRVKPDKVSTVLSSVGAIRFSDTTPLDDANAAAAKANQRTIKLTTFDQKTISVAMGRKPEEKKLKPPAPDAKTGPAALGSVTDLTKKDDAKKDEAKPLAPEFETIPAGPVFAYIASSEASAPVNAAMQKRAYQISDYVFTGLPQKADELFEPNPPAPAPAPSPAPAAAEKKAP
jgi:hypothetical protein